MVAKIKKNQNPIIIFFVLATLGAYFFYGSLHLKSFLTADEHYWIYERIPQYWDALASKDFKKTYINDKPGVSLALVSGFGYFANYSEIRSGVAQNKDIKSLDPHHDNNLADNLLALRLPLVIFNGLLLGLFFWLVKRLTENNWIALWSVIFAALSPILIGITQIINPDALLWSVTAIAIFSYLNLLKCGERKFLILTAVFTGLSLLTKYVASILFPFFIFLLAYYLFSEYGGKIKAKDAKKYVLRQLEYLGVIVIAALATVSVLMPAVLVKIGYLQKLTLDFSGLQKTMWLIGAGIIFLLADAFLNNKPTLFVKKLILRKDIILKIIIFALALVFIVLLVGRNVYPNWSLFQNVPFDIKNLGDIKDKYYPNPANLFLLEFNPLVFSLTPIVLLLLLFLWIKAIFKKSGHNFVIFSLSFFILLYYLGSIFSDTLATIRYSVMLYPLVAFLAGISLWNVSAAIKDYKYKNILFSVAILAASLLSLGKIYPYYFNYTNFLLPQNQIVTDSWGYGGYEAVQYLNSLPGAENMTIWSDFFGVCEFFKGECLTKYDVDFNKTAIDYYVLTRRGKIRYRYSHDKALANKYYAAANPVWQLEIDGRQENYVKVFKASN